MKNKLVISLLLLGLLGCLSACDPGSTPPQPPIPPGPPVVTKDKSLVKIYPVPGSLPTYSKAKLFVGEKEVPLTRVLVNETHAYTNPAPQRIESCVARVAIKGRIDFTLKCDSIENEGTKVLPSAWNIVPYTDLNKKTVTFNIYSAGKYVVEVNGDSSEAIMIIVDEYKENEYSYIDFSKYELVEFKNQAIKTNISLKSNTIYYIHDSAVIQGQIKGNGAENVYIIGHGLVDGSSFNRSQIFMNLDFTRCKNVHIDGLTLIDPPAVSSSYNFCSNFTINNLNIVSSRANGDGISFQSCHDMEVSNCFLRGYDDNLVVKNYPSVYGNSNRDLAGVSYNESFKNCIIWNDLAQCMEIGYETTGSYIKDISFEDITVLHAFHKPVISIHNGNYANVHNVVYKNITVEDASMGCGDSTSTNLIELHSRFSSSFSNLAAGGSTEVGNIFDIEIKNVLVKASYKGNKIQASIGGQKDGRPDYYGITSTVSDVNLIDIQTHLGKLQSVNVLKDKFSSSIELNFTGNPINGATLYRSWSIDELNALDTEITYL